MDGSAVSGSGKEDGAKVNWKFWKKKKPAESQAMTLVKVPISEQKGVSKLHESFLPWETTFVVQSICPDCRHAPLLEGPSAGISTNLYCSNKECGSRFNVAQFGSMVMGERISSPSPLKKGLLRLDD